MKKSIYYIFLCMAVFCGHTFHVFAQVNETDISALDYAIYTLPASANRGGQVTLSVHLKNVNSIATWQADLVLPDGVTIARDDAGDEQIFLSTARTSPSRHSIGWNTQSDGSIRLLCGSNTNKTFTGREGEVATIVLDVSPSLDEGSYPITFNNILMVEPSLAGHALEQTVSRLDIAPVAYTIIATSQDENYGTVKIESSSYNASTHEALAGDQLVVTAIPKNRYSFSRWTKGGAFYSNDNPLVILAESDLTIQAEFEGAEASNHLVKSSVVSQSVKAEGDAWEHTLSASLYNYTSNSIVPSRVVLRYKNDNANLVTVNLDGQSVAPNDKMQVEIKIQTTSVSWENVNFGEESGIFGVDFFYLENGKEIYVASENTTFESASIQASDLKVMYDGKIHSIDCSCTTPGIFDGDIKTEIVRVNGDSNAIVPATEVINAGEYRFTFSIDKYGFSGSKTAFLTIDKPTLYVTAEDKTVAYGEEVPALTFTITGFVNGETVEDLSAMPVATIDVEGRLDVGEYIISVAGGKATNYDFVYINGKLAVVKADQAIVWDQDFEELEVDQLIALEAYSTSGLDVVYSLSNSNATIEYNNDIPYLKCLAPGIVVVYAMQSGNNNYHAAETIQKAITIKESSGIGNVFVEPDIDGYYDIFGRSDASHTKGFLILSRKNTKNAKIFIK